MSRYFNDYYGVDDSDELEHHGILGQKWGIRRFQNENGSLTLAGKKRYGINPNSDKPSSAEKNRIEELKSSKKFGKPSFEIKRNNGPLDTSGKILINDDDHPVTKQAKKDWNEMDDKDFYRKYMVSKRQYLKEVKRKGDPYAKNKLGKAITKRHLQKLAKKTGEHLTDEQYDQVVDLIAKAEPIALKQENDRLLEYQKTPEAKRRAAANLAVMAGYTGYTAYKMHKRRKDRGQ